MLSNNLTLTRVLVTLLSLTKFPLFTSLAIAASGISSDNGDIISNIYIIDTASGIIKSQFLIPDNLITDIKFFSNGNFVAIGDKYATFINPKTKSVVKQFYENNILKFYDFNKKNAKTLEKLTNLGLIEFENEFLKLTDKGVLLENSIIVNLI